MEAEETSLGGLEMREVMNCYGVAMKKQSSYFYLLMYVSTLVYTVQSRQEMHTRDCVLTGLGGHGCGRTTGGVDTGGGWSDRCWSGTGWCCESGNT